MPLYLIILVASFIVPLIMSFEKNLQFHKQFKFLIPAITIVAEIYIIFDIIFTKNGIWGFNPKYHLDYFIFGLPLEEILFFFIIPFASVFVNDVVLYYLHNIHLSKKIAIYLTIFIIFVLSFMLLNYYDKYYTLFAFISVIFALLIALFNNLNLLSSFYITYLFILFPFLIVNGILTGSLLNKEIVWYNEYHILGIRIFTIPIEDFFYGFSLIFFVLYLRNIFKRIYDKKNKKFLVK